VNYLKKYNWDTWLHFTEKTISIYFAQLRHRREADNGGCPDDALLERNISILFCFSFEALLRVPSFTSRYHSRRLNFHELYYSAVPHGGWPGNKILKYYLLHEVILTVKWGRIMGSIVYLLSYQFSRHFEICDRKPINI
jgi:hypothetical protein